MTARSPGWIINGIGQRMIEGQRPDADGGFDLDLRAIQQVDVRKRILEELKSNGTARGRFQLTPAPPHRRPPALSSGSI